MSDSATPWTVAYQASLSMGFSRQEYWSGLPFPSPGDLPDPGIEPESPVLRADALPSEPPGKHYYLTHYYPPNTIFGMGLLLYFYPTVHFVLMESSKNRGTGDLLGIDHSILTSKPGLEG